MSNVSFGLKDHALLFAWLAQAVMQKCPETGAEFVEVWLKSYGHERGIKAALHCMNDGNSLTLKNYFIYSSLLGEASWTDGKIVSLVPCHFLATSCVWSSIWCEYGLEKYGGLYCRLVHPALSRGFSPDLRMYIASTLTEGDSCCNFTWESQALDKDDIAYIRENREKIFKNPPNNTLYNLGYLYDTLRRVLVVRLGIIEAQAILDAGMEQYTAFGGKEKSRAVIKASKQQF